MFSERKSKSQLQFQFLCLLIFLQNSFEQVAAVHPQFKTQQNIPQQKLQRGHNDVQAEQQLQHEEHSQSSTLQEKDILQDAMKTRNVETEFTDPYQMLNELKQNAQSFPSPPSLPFPFALPWNPNPYLSQPYSPVSAFSSPPFASLPFQGLPLWETAKFLPYISYPQPMFIPYPFFMPPEVFYPSFPDSINDFEDTMSRAPNGRRPSHQHARNSPIYYMRLPPTPYMFVPSFGFPSSSSTTQSNYGNSFPPISSFQAYPTHPNLGSTFNVPVNFLANGKPSGIYQMNNFPNNFAAFNNFNLRPSLQPNFNGHYFPTHFGIPTPTAPPPHQDSKLTSIKEPFIFNGRPENMYILQNGFNPIYPGI